jgi:hypothetical protein
MSSSKKLLQAAAGNAGESLYAEDAFSTYLYDGNATARDITNGIDLAGEGGLVWVKSRNQAGGHVLIDTERGAGKVLRSNSTDAEADTADTQNTVNGFNDDGFSLGTDSGNWGANFNNYTYASWTFRKAEKFFDIVTYTGNATANRTVSHNLGSVPGCIIVKGVSGVYGVSNWSVYHRSLGAGTNGRYGLRLNSTSAQVDDGQFGATATDTAFTLNQYGGTNGANTTYVAYLFASDAGGFGDDGSESIIKCGSYTGNNASTANLIDVGFEPQWLMIKGTDRACNWIMADVMRGATVAPSTSFLEANTSDAEATSTSGFALVHPTATGFSIPSGVSGQINEFNENYIYIAIRRPMKTPESGTEVFAVDDRAAATPAFVSDFPVDLYWTRAKTGGNFFDYARLRGDKYLQHDGTDQETDGAAFFGSNTGVGSSGSASTNNLAWMFKRATGFFDVVAYTSTTSAVNHNLGVSPELVIYKSRTAGTWYAMVATDGFGELNSSGAWGGAGNGSGLGINLANATATTITGAGNLYGNGVSMVTYLFATVAGVSKVGSYTGTGNNLNVDCGFSAGARFILIKRTNSTGDWYVYDYFRGIVSGNDPYLLLNTGTGEVTSTDYIDPLSSGFTVTSSAPAALNASGGNYIFLAIA